MEEPTITENSFNQKIGFEFGKNLRDYDSIAQKITRNTKTKFKEITVSEAAEMLLSTEKFSEVLGTIGAGKEATVLIARTKTTNTVVCAKVFRYFTSTVRKRMGGTKHLFHRDIAQIAASQEYWNLVAMDEVGIPVPKPLELVENILVMEMLQHPTDPTQPAPLLRDCHFTDEEQVFIILENAIEILTDLFLKAHFTHGDYNIHNLMLSSRGLVTMDVSQSVEYNQKTNIDTPVRVKIGRAKDVLRTDLYNLNIGFKKNYRVEFDVDTVLNDILNQLPERLKNYLNKSEEIIPYSHYESEVFAQKERFRAEKVLQRTRRSYQRKKR